MIGITGVAVSDDKRVTVIRLTSAVAQRRVRETAENADNIVIGRHARDQMTARGIPMIDVIKILRTGWVDSEPVKDKCGEWKVVVTLPMDSTRTAGVVTLFLDGGRLFVKTVMWVDV